MQKVRKGCLRFSRFPVRPMVRAPGMGADGEEPLHRNAFVSLPRTVSVFLQRWHVQQRSCPFSCTGLMVSQPQETGSFPPFLFLQGFSRVPLHRRICHVSMITPFPNSQNTKAPPACHPVRVFYIPGKVNGAFGPEGCGLLTQAGCVEGLYRKVLRFDGPQGRGLWYHPMGR